jgi:hypothetical protein
MSIRTITAAEFGAELQAQNVPRDHYAVKCPVCGTVQSLTSFYVAGLSPEMAEKQIAYSCIGRQTKAGPHKKEAAPGKGCDWTLGGLFQFHTLLVLAGEKTLPTFEPATAEEAKTLMEYHERKGRLARIWDLKGVQKRADLVERTRALLDECRQCFRDAEHWNANVRKPHEAPLNPDPHGELAKIIEACETCLKKEDARDASADEKGGAS